MTVRSVQGHTPSRWRALGAGALLAWSLVALFFLASLLHPAWLPQYHPFHPNHSHLTQSYEAQSLGGLLHTLYAPFVPPRSEIEGWYCKLTTATGRGYAVIYLWYTGTGSASGDDSVSGVHVLDGHNRRSHFYRRPLSAFRASPLPTFGDTLAHWFSGGTRDGGGSDGYYTQYTNFTVHVGESTLSTTGITGVFEAQPGDDTTSRFALSVALVPSDDLPPPPSPQFFSPTSHSIGIFAFTPLACVQQMIGMRFDTRGSITIDGETVDLDGGDAYLEKTRGTSFPDNYLWLHATKFHSLTGNDTNIPLSFFVSLATVPIVGSFSIPGFVSAMVYNGRYYHFASQLGSIVETFHSNDTHIQLTLQDDQFVSELVVSIVRHNVSNHSAALYAATEGQLKKVIHQQIGWDVLTLTLNSLTRTDTNTDRYHRTGVFHSQSRHMGLEAMIVNHSLMAHRLSDLYEQVRPWRTDWLNINLGPVMKFSVGRRFVRAVVLEHWWSLVKAIVVAMSVVAGTMLVRATFRRSPRL